MADELLHQPDEPPEQVELERLKQKYRDTNKAIDRSRELLEEELSQGYYGEEDADRQSANFEQSARESLAEIEREMVAHARRHGLRIG